MRETLSEKRLCESEKKGSLSLSLSHKKKKRLPRTDDVHYVFIIALDKPIRQGQQRYGHLVWQLKRTDASIDVNLSDEEIASRYGTGSGLKQALDGPLYQLVARVFKVLSSKKVFTTGKFRSFNEQHAINCSVKARTGQLYPLERSFVFIHQPTLVLRFEDVAAVEFERFSGYGQGSATRNFDLRVQMKTGTGDAKEHTFTSIERNEYKQLLEFLSQKGLKIRNLDQTAARERQQLTEVLGGDESESEEEPSGGRGSRKASRGTIQRPLEGTKKSV